jgi:hypothetical protein
MHQLPRKPSRLAPRALVVRRETIRTLGALELARVQGGGAGAPGTGPVDSCAPDQCTIAAD